MCVFVIFELTLPAWWLETAGRAGIDYSIQPIYMVAALHIYHMIPGLGFRVGFSDYFHHIVFAGSICSVGMLYESGPLQNFIALFICGLPGGLDYIMLVMVKMGKMLPKREKVLNARINLWLRAPGLTASTLFVYITARCVVWLFYLSLE